MLPDETAAPGVDCVAAPGVVGCPVVEVPVTEPHAARTASSGMVVMKTRHDRFIAGFGRRRKPNGSAFAEKVRDPVA